jgi:predicted TIM-barrel fold metal-dependent hydrolase
MSDNIILVSADSHAGARPEQYRQYMEKLALDHYDEFMEDNERYVKAMAVFSSGNGTYGPERLELIDPDNAIRSGGVDGASDPERRLQEMDREGVAAEVLFLGTQNSIEPFFGPTGREAPLDLRAAGLRAFHRWMADFIAEGDGRLIGTADVAGVDMDAMVAELRWCAEHGFGAVQVPGLCGEPALPPLYDAFYEPFWSFCSEARFAMAIHAGWGAMKHGQFTAMFEQVTGEGGARADGNFAAEGAEMFFALDNAPRRAMWQLMAGGVFDRHPDLKLVITEVRADWMPAAVALFDERFARGDTPMKRKPSEYFQDNFFVSASSTRRNEVEMRHEIGVNRILFGRDYPHPEGTWPNTADWIRATFGGIPEDEARLILGENAIECFGLDRDKLAQVAARIGLRPADVLGDFHVDPALIEHFHLRSGYSGPATVVDMNALLRTADEDLAQLVATRSA